MRNVSSKTVVTIVQKISFQLFNTAPSYGGCYKIMLTLHMQKAKANNSYSRLKPITNFEAAWGSDPIYCITG